MEQETYRERLREICRALQEAGFRPVDQLVGYILTEDPTYITNHAGARKSISKIDRDQLMREMIVYYLRQSDKT